MEPDMSLALIPLRILQWGLGLLSATFFIFFVVAMFDDDAKMRDWVFLGMPFSGRELGFLASVLSFTALALTALIRPSYRRRAAH